MCRFLFIIVFFCFFSCKSDKTQNESLEQQVQEEPKTVIDEKGNLSYKDGSVSVTAKVKNGSNDSNKKNETTSPVQVKSSPKGAGSAERKNGIYSFTGTGFSKAAQVKNEPVAITGANNSITLVGKITDLSIIGNDNIVFVDYVKNIDIKGINNKVYWKFQTEGNDPVSAISGLGNLVEKKDFQ
ncbi:MAG: DUF3060 domain-containing protein [Bacteroidota bacterium]